jgi:hypothetical protein
MLRPQVTPFGKDTIPLSSVELDHIPIWRSGPMEWVTQLAQDGLACGPITAVSASIFTWHLLCVCVSSSVSYKDTAIASGATLIQGDLICRSLIPSAKTLF